MKTREEALEYGLSFPQSLQSCHRRSGYHNCPLCPTWDRSCSHHVSVSYCLHSRAFTTRLRDLFLGKVYHVFIEKKRVL